MRGLFLFFDDSALSADGEYFTPFHADGSSVAVAAAAKVSPKGAAPMSSNGITSLY